MCGGGGGGVRGFTCPPFGSPPPPSRMKPESPFKNWIVVHFRALSPVFNNCNSNSSVTVAEHEAAKLILSIGIHFRQSFTQNRLPDIWYNAVTVDELQFEKMMNLILAFLTRLAAETNFSDNWQIWMLNI